MNKRYLLATLYLSLGVLVVGSAVLERRLGVFLAGVLLLGSGGWLVRAPLRRTVGRSFGR